jgi:hypothetical protein
MIYTYKSFFWYLLNFLAPPKLLKSPSCYLSSYLTSWHPLYMNVPDRTLEGMYLLNAILMQWCNFVTLLESLNCVGGGIYRGVYQINGPIHSTQSATQQAHIASVQSTCTPRDPPPLPQISPKARGKYALTAHWRTWRQLYPHSPSWGIVGMD